MQCGSCGHEQDEGWFCGHCGARIDDVPVEDRTDAPSPARTSTLARVLAGVAAVIVAFGLWRFVGGDSSGPADTSVALPAPTVEPPARPSPTSPPAPSTPLPSDGPWPVQHFDGETGTVLLFDDGRDGGVAVDLDTGEAVHVDLPGQRSGDQPFRLHRMGSWVVVGRGDIFAVPVGRDRATRHLGGAAHFLPAARPDRLWLVDQPSGATGAPAAWTLVDVSGEVLLQGEGTQEPLRGVPGGLALRRSDGSLVRYDLLSQEVVDYLDPDARAIADATRDRVVWCTEACDELRVADATGATVSTIGSEGETFDPNAAWLSGDGSRLGAVVRVEVGAGVDRRVRVYDARTGTELVDAQLRLGAVHGNWTGDGGQFFYWLSFGVAATGAPLEVGRWTGGNQLEQVDVAPHGSGLQGFVALPRRTVATLFTQDQSDH